MGIEWKMRLRLNDRVINWKGFQGRIDWMTWGQCHLTPDLLVSHRIRFYILGGEHLHACVRVCILDRKIFLNPITHALWGIFSVLVIPLSCNTMSHLSCVGKLFLTHKWTQTVILFLVFNPAVFDSLLMSSFQESCCGQHTCHSSHFSTSQGKHSVTLPVKTKWVADAETWAIPWISHSEQITQTKWDPLSSPGKWR